MSVPDVRGDSNWFVTLFPQVPLFIALVRVVGVAERDVVPGDTIEYQINLQSQSQ